MAEPQITAEVNVGNGTSERHRSALGGAPVMEGAYRFRCHMLPEYAYRQNVFGNVHTLTLPVVSRHWHDELCCLPFDEKPNILQGNYAAVSVDTG